MSLNKEDREIWKNLDERYRVSSRGRVQFKKSYKRKGGKTRQFHWIYCRVFWKRRGNVRTKHVYVHDNPRAIHVLVSIAFMPGYTGQNIIFKNGDRGDCRLTNLAYANKDVSKMREEIMREFHNSPQPLGSKAKLARELGINKNNLSYFLRRFELEDMKPLVETNFTDWKLQKGKVRDVYDLNNGLLALVSTDRISAFDAVVGTVKGRGQLLNGLSAFWFKQIEEVLPTHFVASPHPNVSIVKKVTKEIPIEFIPRGYATGSLYERSTTFSKNSKLERPLMTYTTKAEQGEHDEWLEGKEIEEQQLLSPAQLKEANTLCVQIYMYGAFVAKSAGLTLADTKIELGWIDNKITVIDEILTPDSSRYWDTQTKSILDKDLLRNWLMTCDDVAGQGLSEEIQKKILNGYRKAYTALTKTKFHMTEAKEEEIYEAINKYA